MDEMTVVCERSKEEGNASIIEVALLEAVRLKRIEEAFVEVPRVGPDGK